MSSDAADRIHSAAIHLIRRVREVDECMGVTPARASALSVLVFGGPRTLTELAQAEHVTTATMSRLVTALEGEGLVRREPHGAEAGPGSLHPPGKGRGLRRQDRGAAHQFLDSLLPDP